MCSLPPCHLNHATRFRVLVPWWTLEETLPIRKVDRWTGRSSCSLWIAGIFWWPCASGHGDRRLLCLWIRSILGSWWLLEWTPMFPFWSAAPPDDDSMQTNRLRDADHLSSSAPGTVGCRTREMFHSEPSLWFPRTAGHPRPAGDPGGCSWCGKRCSNGWVEVNVESLDPPLPWLCWWPDRTPADFATEGQSLPGEPPPVRVTSTSACCWSLSSSRRLAMVGHWDVDGLPGRTLHERTVCPVWWSSEWWVDL